MDLVALSPIHCCENLSPISLTKIFVLHARIKHIEIDLYFVHDMVISVKICMQHVPSTEQVIDIITKPLSQPRFVLLNSKLSVVSPPTA